MDTVEDKVILKFVYSPFFAEWQHQGSLILFEQQIGNM